MRGGVSTVLIYGTNALTLREASSPRQGRAGAACRGVLSGLKYKIQSLTLRFGLRASSTLLELSPSHIVYSKLKSQKHIRYDDKKKNITRNIKLMKSGCV